MKILIADAKKSAISFLSKELKTVFTADEITPFSSCEEAIKCAEKLRIKGEQFEYAFLDIYPGKFDGINLAKSLKEKFPNINIIFCTEYENYALEAFRLYAKGYLIKPVTADAVRKVLDEMVPGWNKESGKKVRVQTFGHFEIFVNDVPVAFKREKAKELLAYLIDRHGASVTTEQIAMVLWEDELYDRKLKNKTTVVVASLKNTLDSVGAGDILVKTWNHLSVNIQKLSCDSYDFEKGKEYIKNSFYGEYMTNYSWAEYTTGKYVQMDTWRKRTKKQK